MTAMTLCYNMYEWREPPRTAIQTDTEACMQPLLYGRGGAMRIERDWLSVQEVADYLGVARPTIYRWAKESRIRIYKLAKGVARVKRQDLEAFLQRAGMLYSDTADRATRPGFVRESAESHPQETDPILDVLGSLSGDPLSDEDIEKELY